MNRKSVIPLRVGEEAYREETVRGPGLLTLLLVVLIAAPLIYWMSLINREGTRTADVSQYTVLVDALDSNVKTVDAMLRNDLEEVAAINAASENDRIKLNVPDFVIMDEEPEAPRPNEPFNATLSGIYWNTSNPLVGINGETYRLGDTVQNYEIIEIGKSKVRFLGPDGEIVIMDINESLHKFK